MRFAPLLCVQILCQQVLNIGVERLCKQHVVVKAVVRFVDEASKNSDCRVAPTYNCGHKQNPTHRASQKALRPKICYLGQIANFSIDK